MKILVEKSFATSKEAMRILLPKINEERMDKVYHRNFGLAARFKRKSYDVIYLFFYDCLEQVNHGLPYCRTVWVDEKLSIEHSPIVSEPNEIIGGINIYWDDVDYVSDLIEDNILDKGVYLPSVDLAFSQFNALHDKVLRLSGNHDSQQITFDKYIKK